MNSSELSARTKQIRRSVVQNQMLFTAGYSLTTGGFLYYFMGALGAATWVLTVLLALPEIVGVLAVLTPLALRLTANRKRLFVATSILARLCTCGIPLVVLLPENWSKLSFLIGVLALQGVFQSIAYTAYLSWLSDLAPENSWGRFFARRDIAKALVLIFIPVAASILKDYLRDPLTTDSIEWTGYLIAFGIGNLLQLISLIPLLKWPAVEVNSEVAHQTAPTIPSMTDHPGYSMRGFLGILAFSWWLAFFQGMTQTAFFLHSYRELQVSLTNYYLLTGVMYALQMVTAAIAGQIGDRRGYRNMLLLSTFAVSFAIPFWMFSLQGNWLWLWGAYAMWGLFGAVNLSLQNQLLIVTPRHRNTFQLALCRQGAGLIAGLTGLAGGFWLEKQLASEAPFQWMNYEWNPFLLIFALSFLGRLTAPLWLFLVPRGR